MDTKEGYQLLDFTLESLQKRNISETVCQIYPVKLL